MIQVWARRLLVPREKSEFQRTEDKEPKLMCSIYEGAIFEYSCQFDKAIDYIMDGFFRETLSQIYLDNIKKITLCECPEELAEDKSQNCIRCNVYVCKVSTFNPYSAESVYRNS